MEDNVCILRNMSTPEVTKEEQDPHWGEEVQLKNIYYFQTKLQLKGQIFKYLINLLNPSTFSSVVDKASTSFDWGYSGNDCLLGGWYAIQSSCYSIEILDSADVRCWTINIQIDTTFSLAVRCMLHLLLDVLLKIV